MSRTKTARGGETPGPGRDHARPSTSSRKTTKMQTYSSYVVVAGTEYAVDTLDQIAVAEAALVEAGEESAPVWTGDSSVGEGVKNGRILFAPTTAQTDDKVWHVCSLLDGSYAEWPYLGRALADAAAAKHAKRYPDARITIEPTGCTESGYRQTRGDEQWTRLRTA